MPEPILRRSSPAARLIVLLAACGLAAGCAKPRAAGEGSRGGAVAGEVPRRILLDGEFSDWPAGRAVTGDADWLYLRVRVEGSRMPLQASEETLTLLLDADGDAATGAKLPRPAEAGRLGVDLAVEFSPRNAEGGIDRGVRVVAFDAGGAERRELGHASVNVSSAPTHAAEEFEVRIDRHSEEGRRLATGLGARGGTVTTMFTLADAAGKLVGWSEPESASLPPASASAPRADVLIPPKPPGAVRVVTLNVLRSALVNNPQPVVRMLRALDPDAVLFQEWETDDASASAWFSSNVGARAWAARATGRAGVVVASPWPLEALGQTVLIDASRPEAGNRPDVRFVGALVRSPAGELAVASLHLKCCGTAGSSEDARRMAEAEAINAAWKALAPSAGLRVIGGDFNLVGTRPPLDVLRAGLDADGGDLGVAQARVLGDGAFTTWRDPGSEFSPGRLDFLVYGSARAEIVQSFVLDTARLSDRSLTASGLDRGDAGISDHLPVVIDLRPR